MHQSIIKTLCFYDAVGGVALTKIELYKYLLGQSSGKNPQLKEGSFYDFLSRLEKTPLDTSIISGKRGFYFLSKNKLGYEKRIDFSKTGIKKWKLAKKMIRLLSLVPYTRMIAVTGSLSLNTTTTKSDIDLLIVSKAGRIWSTRIFATALMHVLGKRRHSIFISDRICLNHYIADSDLFLAPKNLFSAHIFLSLIPVWSYPSTKSEFILQNEPWSRICFANGRGQTFNLHQFGQKSKSFQIKNILENIVPNFIQECLETVLKNAQIYKIKHTLKTNRANERDIIFNDLALVFHHPRPKRQEALYLYKKNLRAFNAIDITL